MPLFINNNQRALGTQAEASQHASEALLKQAQLQAVTDVEKAYQAYTTARKILDLYTEENLSHLERLRTVATVSYREGASSLFELLDSQRAYGAGMTSYNQARADYQVTLWDLERAVGRPLR
jgi:outer membrane protein TolC